MKTILASFLAVAFLASTPAFAGDKPADKAAGDKAAGDKGDMKKKDDKKKDEKKDEKKAGGGW
jgi:ribosomal protein L12E/L44/L45/RPP1/RPP2